MSGTRAAIRKGLACRCPQCGRGRLFQGFLKVAPTCEVCGLDLSAQDSGDGPAAFVVLIVGFIVVGAALVVEVNYGWPIWLHMLVWLPLASVLSMAFLRPLKGVMISLHYLHRRDDFDSGG